MKRIFAILLLFSVAASGYAQEAAKSTITSFWGLTSLAHTDKPGGIPLDMLNLDVVGGREAGQFSLKRRIGFQRIGDEIAKVGGTRAIAIFTPEEGDAQLIAVFGNTMYFYDEVQGSWEAVNINPLIGVCEVRQGVDTIYGIGTRWFYNSCEDYTEIKIASPDSNYTIRRIMSDDILIIEDPFPDADMAAVACTLVGTGTGTSSEAFEGAQGLLEAIVFNDSLHFMSNTERVAYGGNSNIAINAATLIDSIGIHDTGSVVTTIYADNTFEAPCYVHIQAPGNPVFNLALYVPRADDGSFDVVCDTIIHDWLADDPDSNYTCRLYLNWDWTDIDTLSTLRELIASTSIIDADKDSLMTADTTAVFDNYMIFSKPDASHYGMMWKRRLWQLNPYALFRWAVDDPGAASMVADSLVWMTALAENNVIGGKNSGLYPRAFPVYQSGDGDSLILNTYGVVGGTIQRRDSTAFSIVDWDAEQPCYSSFFEGRTLYCDAVNNTRFYPADINHNYDYLVFEEWDGDTDTCVTCSNFVVGVGWSTTDLCSLAQSCTSPENPIPDIANDGATLAYDETENIGIDQLPMLAKATLAGSYVADTTWNWPVVALLFDKFWGVGAPGDQNQIISTKDLDLNTDSIVYNAWIYEGHGTYPSALIVEQNLIYVHYPNAIFVLVVDRETLDPVGTYPTASVFGALSQQGVTLCPRGHFFIGHNGVNQFDGNNSILFSGAISDFWRDSVDAASLPEAAIGYNPHEDRLYVSASRKGAIGNDVTLTYDFQTGAWGKYDIEARFWEMLTWPSNYVDVFWGHSHPSIGGVFSWGQGNVKDSGMYVFPSFWQSTWMPIAGRFGEMTVLLECFIENRRDSLGSIEVSVFIDEETTASSVDTIDGTGDGWRTDRESFKPGVRGERFSLKLESIGLDTMDVSGTMISHSPAGVIE